MLGAVLAEVFGSSASNAGGEGSLNGGGAGDERGQASRITSKQHCIKELLQRALDKSAYTRCVGWSVAGLMVGWVPSFPWIPAQERGVYCQQILHLTGFGVAGQGIG